MPAFTFTSPEGQSYTVNGPDGATQAQAFQMLQSSGQMKQTKQASGGSTLSDVGSSGLEGLVRGGEALLGLPGDALHGARYLAEKGVSALTGQPEKPISDILPTSASLRARREALLGPGYKPQTTAGKYAETIGEFVPGAALAPEEGIGKAIAKYGVAPGIASEAAGQATEGTPLEPYARAAAGVAGGLAPAVGKVAQQGAKSFLAPFTEEGRQDIAARGFRDAFTDPRKAQIDLEAAKATQQPGAGMGEVVPGSRPTTGQLTGDQGALQLERSLANENRTAFHENQYGTGADQQNAARSAALSGIQPTGAATDVSDQIRKGLADVEASHDQAVSGALSQAQTAAAGVGKGLTPEAQGSALRGALQAGRDAAKANERKLWNAIDPDGTLAMPAGPVSSAAGEISGSIPRTARPMSGEEAAIFETAQSLPSIAPFNEMTALRSRISTAMREEMRAAGQSPTYARLTQLRGKVEDAINSAAVHKSVVDDAAVKAGDMDARDSLRARVDGLFDADKAGQGSGGSAERSAASAGAAPSAASSSAGGAARQGDRRLRDGSSGQGIPGQEPGNKVYYPSGSLDVEHEVVNLHDLVTSHDANFNINRNYPQELQPRARETAPARDQVNSMAARLQPERLGPSPEANSGAPIVGPDNVVESGNGRTLAIGKAYKNGRADAYRKFLEDQGHDLTGIDQPVLIARRKTDLSPEDRVAFAHSANTASGLRMNAAEQAASDARLITPDALEQIAPGTKVSGEENRGFVRSFLKQLPAAERGGMLDASGNLSQAGVRRVEAAMASRAYGDGEFVAKAFDAADPNIRGLAGALTDASGSWMRMRQAVREGVIDAEHDITTDLMNAARAVIRARDAGRPVSEILNQADMFGGEASSLAKNLILNDKGAVASREQISSRLERYATEAQKNLAAPSMFGDVVKPADVLRTVLKNEGVEPEAESAALRPGPQSNMDAGAAARLRAASSATRARAQTFDQGPVGDVLKARGGGSSDYRLPDSAVPGRVWAPGPRGAQIVNSYGKAAGSKAAIEDAAAESLRRETMNAEGIIDPAKFASWKKRYQDAIRALPVEAQARFNTAGAASQAYEDAAAARKAAVDASQTGMAKRLAGLSNSQDITRTVGSIFGSRNAVEQMRELAGKLKGSPEAMAGLKKAVADHVASIATGTTEAGASGVNKVNASGFQKFVARNEAVLKAAGFTDGQISIMKALANDLQRSQRTMQATALPASPNTAADVMGAMRAAAKEAGSPSLLSKITAAAWAGLHVGGPAGALTGAGGAIGEHLTRAMRGAGLAKARDIIQAGILDPEIGRQLLRRAGELPDSAAERALAKAIAKKSIFVAPGVSASVQGQK